MFLDAELHLAYKIANTPILNFPFPHMYVENIFPDDFYSKIQENLLEQKEMTSLADNDTDNYGLAGYKERFIVDLAKEEAMSKVQKEKQKFLSELGEIFTKGTFSKLERPKLEEGFDELYFVKLVEDKFGITKWKDEI